MGKFFSLQLNQTDMLFISKNTSASMFETLNSIFLENTTWSDLDPMFAMFFYTMLVECLKQKALFLIQVIYF